MPDPLYRTAVEATALVTLWVGLSVWERDRRAPAGLWFLGMTTAIFVWCAGEILAQWALFGDLARNRVLFLGVLCVPPLWVGVAAHASGLDVARRIPWFPVVLLAPSAVLYALLYLGPWSSAFLVSNDTPGDEGPLFGIWVTYGYALMLLGVALFVRAAARWPAPGLRPRIASLAVAILIPVAGNALYLYGDVGWSRDPTPVLMGISALPLRTALFGSGLLDILPVDQRDILRHLPVGLVIADGTSRVLDVNPVAEDLLGLPRQRALGRSLEAVLAHLPRGSRVEVTPVAGRWATARCAVIHPDLEEERARVA